MHVRKLLIHYWSLSKKKPGSNTVSTLRNSWRNWSVSLDTSWNRGKKKAQIQHECCCSTNLLENILIMTPSFAFSHYFLEEHDIIRNNNKMGIEIWCKSTISVIATQHKFQLLSQSAVLARCNRGERRRRRRRRRNKKNKKQEEVAKKTEFTFRG